MNREDIMIEEVREELIHKINNEGEVLGKNFLRVDSFLNHQVSPKLLENIGKAITKKFIDKKITKVVTAEAGGNIIAYIVANHLSNYSSNEVSVIYAKKGVPKTMKNPIIQKVESATKGGETELAICRDYLSKEDRTLMVDDFLYTGLTSEALTKLVEKTGATVTGYAFVISKWNFGGYDRLKKYGIPIFTLVNIKEMDPENGKIYFNNSS